MLWSELGTEDQREAHRLRDSLAAAGLGVHLDQVADCLAAARAWAAGTITREQLQQRTRWPLLADVVSPDVVPADPVDAAAFWRARQDAFGPAADAAGAP